LPDNSTKQFIDIQDIRDDVVILKDGSMRQIIEVGSINFELKSQDEQMAILQRFREFLNSLDFSLSIQIMSRKININDYLKLLEQVKEKQKNELLRIQVIEYSRFIKGLTELANIMSKKFFIAVPYYFSIAPKKEGISEMLKNIFKPSEQIKKMTDEEFNSYKIQLRQRVNLVMDGLAPLGLNAKVLQRNELINLYYKLYNPEATEQIMI